MKSNDTLFTLLTALSISASVYASDANVDGKSVTGMVERLYVADRFSKALFLGIKIHKPAPGQELWAELRPADGTPSVMAQLPAAARVETGNIVEAQLAQHDATLPASLDKLALIRVTKVVAKHDTPDALAFGLSKDGGPKTTTMRRTQEVLAPWLRGPRAPQ
jgi:hypothetical protein